MNDQTTETLPELCQRHGVTLAARFEGLKETPAKSKDSRPWKHFLWSVTLTRGKQTIETPWKAGVGHAKKTDRKPWSNTPNEFTARDLGVKGAADDRFIPTTPAPADVLHSLILDSEACDMSFEEWADSFGYDTDSRKAEATYRECQTLGFKVRRFLGSEFEAFRTAAQEY